MVKVEILHPQIVPIEINTAKETIIELNNTVIEVVSPSDVFRGPYYVIPKANDVQILECKTKVMTENVIVDKVPYFETSNEYGDTVYIAEVIN